MRENIQFKENQKNQIQPRIHSILPRIPNAKLL